MPQVDDAWRQFLPAIQANGASAEAPLSALDLRDNNLETPPLDLANMFVAEGAEAPLPEINWPDRMEAMLSTPGNKVMRLLVSTNEWRVCWGGEGFGLWRENAKAWPYVTPCDRVNFMLLSHASSPAVTTAARQVDITIHNYDKLYRAGGAGGKKGGKKKKVRPVIHHPLKADVTTSNPVRSRCQ